MLFCAISRFVQQLLPTHLFTPVRSAFLCPVALTFLAALSSPQYSKLCLWAHKGHDSFQPSFIPLLPLGNGKEVSLPPSLISACPYHVVPSSVPPGPG